MKKVMVVLFLIYGFPLYAGTVNCDAEDPSLCPSSSCPSTQQAYCDVILGSKGPKGIPMGFCKCRLKTPSV